jgi:glycosyltransferase involved in cell wall biosynthesis
MMNPSVLLATYNYYPWHWGGSEVYVKGLAKYLQEKGYEVTVLASIPEEGFEHAQVIYQDEFLKAGTYRHEGVEVVGCSMPVTTKENYSRYNPRWKSTWFRFFEKYFDGKPAPILLHLNANTALISAALVEAAREIFPGIATIYSYHVTEGCPKGSLLYFGKELCPVKPGTQACTACTLHERLGTTHGAAKMLGKMIPDLPLPEKLPSIFNIKRFTRLNIEGFARFADLVDKWLVFSNQVEQTLTRLGIPAKQIAMIRHGIDEQFLESNPREKREVTDSNTFVFVGRFKKIKGIHTLLRAWLSLPESPRRRLWLIGGSGEQDPSLERMLAQTSDRKDVENLGALDVEALRARLRQAQCIIIPTEWVETGPLVLHEAVACGTNVIASSIGGCAELVQYYGEGCQLFRMGDAGDLAKKLEAFRYQPLQKKVMSQPEHYGQVLSYYEAILEKHAGKRRNIAA